MIVCDTIMQLVIEQAKLITMYVPRENIYSIFSSNSEANASELLENLE